MRKTNLQTGQSHRQTGHKAVKTFRVNHVALKNEEKTINAAGQLYSFLYAGAYNQVYSRIVPWQIELER